MKIRVKKLKQYIRKIRKAKYKRGFSIHSPFVYHFVTTIVREQEYYYAYKDLENIIGDYFNELPPDDELSSLKKHIFTKERRKYSRFLLRAVNYFKPETLLEIGTSTGVDTLYLSNPLPDLTCTTIEENKRLYEIAQELINKVDGHHARAMQGDYLKVLDDYVKHTEKIDFVCCNLVYPAPVSEIYARCYKQLHEKSVFILRGIHDNDQQHIFWEKIRQDERVIVSLDLYSFGILFYNPVLTKKHYTLCF